ncbi:MAG: hypothetical protein K0U49_11565 [Alphaproteobacteria bacterium]|nr:hypothetical protein [Alphaproteobacteria bacterium]
MSRDTSAPCHATTMAYPYTTMASAAMVRPWRGPRTAPVPPASGGRPADGRIDPLETQRTPNAPPKFGITDTPR